MRKIFLILLAALLVPVPQLRAEGYDAVVREHTEQFTMQSLENGTLTVHRVVEVLSENGLEAATMIVYTDRFQMLTAFSGTVIGPGGRKETLKKKDLATVSIAPGIAGDGFMTGYRPRAAGYPFTVSYDFTVQYRKGFAVFPTYTPVQAPRTRLEAGTFRLNVPADAPIRYLGTGPVPEPSVSEKDGVRQYCWEIRNYGGFVDEHDMPPFQELAPAVHASPDRFVYDGVPGSQASWKELGDWQYRLLQGTEDLPQATLDKVRELTAGAATDLDKVRILYDFLRKNTRYVSIQFGIGGFKPFPAATVDKTGFGDCKALSNYFKALLAAAGVASDYTILNTRRAKLMPGYSSFGQTNHAMLAVPLQALGDTLWVECTHPSLPLGYRHDGIAGHEVVLIGADGGQVRTVRPYPDSICVRSLRADITLDPDGNAALSIHRRATADQTESWIDYGELDDDDKRDLLVGGLDGQAQGLSAAVVTDNFNAYDGPDWVPACEVSYHFEMFAYGRRNGDRMMVAVNPFSKRLLSQRSERVNPYVSESSCAYSDTVVLRLPAGYAVEKLPADIHLDQAWGRFDSQVREADGAIVVTQVAQMKACRAEADRYKDYREFVRALNRAYTASAVLRKSD